MTPRSGVSVDDEVGGVGVIPGPQWTTAFGSIYIRTADLLWVAFGRQFMVSVEWMGIHSTFGDEKRVPSSSSTVQGVPLVPLLSSSSYVSSSDTAPPPRDLLAGLLYTAPPPSTGDGSFDSCLSSP
ncbi:uncharacterized protein UHOD_12365 [Ustilago sp. UG-2017b]|nr:uncharacterized protein UHOD_12365 [Ustilago sp. UG-2017b]